MSRFKKDDDVPLLIALVCGEIGLHSRGRGQDCCQSLLEELLGFYENERQPSAICGTNSMHQ
jgi:hypothetical protein